MNIQRPVVLSRAFSPIDSNCHGVSIRPFLDVLPSHRTAAPSSPLVTPCFMEASPLRRTRRWVGWGGGFRAVGGSKPGEILILLTKRLAKRL